MVKIRRKIRLNNSKTTPGALLIYFGIGVLFLLIIGQFIRLMIFQTIDDEDLVARGEDKYSVSSVSQAERGDITDRSGNILASDMEAYRVVVITDENYPNHVSNPEETAKILSEVIDMDKKEIQELIEKSIEEGRFQMELGQAGRNISYNDKNFLQDSEATGLVFEPETRRFYPNGQFASHLIGLAELNQETQELTGQLGLEKIYDDLLSGEDGSMDYNQDVWGYIVPDTDKVKAPVDGHDVKLTIDSNIQLYLEDSLKDMEEHFKPEELIAVVADAKTGEILASGQRPSFNPETREGFGNSWLNMLYEYSFEPGSTFKVFGLAAAIEEGVYDPDAVYTSGSMDVMDATIYDWEKSGWGNITYNEGMQYSSNVLMMILQDKVGADKMLDYYKKFGFGETTGSEFPTESSGQIAWDNELQQKTTSFGQSSTVTPIQLIQGMTALLNEGQMKKPYVVDEITDENGEVVYQGEEEVVRQVISKEAANKTVEEMNTLIGGSLDHNPQYKSDDYEVTGKSGTAQVYDPETGGYLDGDYQFFTSFLGYAPKDDPEVIIYYGIKLASENESETWDYGVSRGFNPLMERTLKYLEVSNADVSTEHDVIEIGDYTGQQVDSLLEELNDTIDVKIVGEGTEITDQFPKDDTLLPYDTLFVKTDGDATMPDFKGLSKREAIILSDFIGIDITVNGEGYVESQSINAGTVLSEDSALEVTLSSKDPND